MMKLHTDWTSFNIHCRAWVASERVRLTLVALGFPAAPTRTVYQIAMDVAACHSMRVIGGGL